MKYNEIIQKESNVLNHEGAAAFKMSPEMELYTAAVTSALSGKFYESPKEFIARITDLVRRVDPVFVAQLAVYTRTQMNLRSIPLLLLVELAKCHSGDDLVSRAVGKTVMRADEISELLACYQWRNPSQGIKKLGKLSRQIQNGLKEAFNRFDEYQFAKYDRKDAEIKMRDALFLVHPKAKDAEQQAIFDKIVAGTLETPYTWETQLSALGQQHFESPEAKNAAVKALWEELLDSGKLGYMALLRNLRNILQSGVSPEHVERLCTRISDPEQVAKSKQLPFRFLAAYKEIMGEPNPLVGLVLEALEKAVLCSADNIEGFDINTNVLLACDVSGSMYVAAGNKSSIQNVDIGVLLASILRTKCKAVIAGIFGNTWELASSPIKPILANTVGIRSIANRVGYSTNGYKVVDWLIENNVKMDKVMIFTDCQMWDSHRGYYRSDKEIKDSWHKYKEMYPQAKLYLFDLAGYGTSPLDLAEQDVYLIAGWSEKIFDVLSAVDNGADALSEIRKIVL
ncbi:MAG: TROVE domain-containing protein [Bacteroidales bacterium]|nr:TROVE domain-containing protein [Bacteroidales bacterium]MBR5736002.1 TROVE domain-containing protein [Bacteroidales bacterium]